MIRWFTAGIVVVTGSLSLGVLANQEPQTTEPPRFRVSVDVVRIDAVVTDRDGRIVTDLTANDFEVLQDGKPQKVTFAQFVPVAAPARDSTAPPSIPQGTLAPVLRAPPAQRAAIQRTLAVVVDDLGLSVESLAYAKRALHTFVDRDLQPTDLVGILRTSSSNSVQPFTTDRRILHAAIDAVRWSALSRSGVEAFDPLNTFASQFDDRHGMGDVTDFAVLNAGRRSLLASGSLGALNIAIQGARDLPGRKALMFVSEGFDLISPVDFVDSRVRIALDRVIDQAARSGVVIYSLDARGLQTGGLLASDNLKVPSGMQERVRTEAADRLSFNRNTQEALAYVAEQTGGFAILNTNDLGAGLGKISADIRDYYVIGYAPDEGTFVGKGKKPSYHKIAVKVRRPGLKVRTRKEFLGVSDVEASTVPLTPAQELIRAALSPFSATEIPLTATTLSGYAPDEGLFARALLHIDARALTFVEGDGGKKTASADVLGMVFDQDGTEVAHLSTGFSVGLTDQTTDEALRDGLAYTLRIQIPRAGAYQVRFSIRDQQSGKLGSAGDFVQLDDIPSGAFALSGIVLRGGDGGFTSEASGASMVALSPSQALTAFPSGTDLAYAYEIYNAAEPVQSVASIWRGDQNVATLPMDKLVPPAGSASRFAAVGRLKFSKPLPPGTYLLQVSAATADPKNRRRLRTAVQRIQFDLH